jgi:hypothetical protein
MLLAYIRLIFRGSFVEIATAILSVYKILKKPLDVFGYWYLYLVSGTGICSMTGTDTNNQIHLTAF